MTRRRLASTLALSCEHVVDGILATRGVGRHDVLIDRVDLGWKGRGFDILRVWIWHVGLSEAGPYG